MNPRRSPGDHADAAWSGAVELHTLCFVGIYPERIRRTANLFATADRPTLLETLREEAGHPWAATALKSCWDENEAEARDRGIFDLIWHQRAMETYPIVSAQDFEGFHVLLDAARQVDPDLASLLSCLDGNDPENPRQQDPPDWVRAWHSATATRCGGWLDTDEVRTVTQHWAGLATPEVEEGCLLAMGATYTQPGCWSLMSNLGGFFAQCGTEDRAVVVEVD